MSLAALRSPGFRRYLVGNAFALNGLWLGRLTMGWLAWDLTGQAGFVGLVSFLVFAPTLVSGPLFGVIADRIEPRWWRRRACRPAGSRCSARCSEAF
jgi:MFS family permease